MSKQKLSPLPSAAFQILLSLAFHDLHGYGIMRQVAEQNGNYRGCQGQGAFGHRDICLPAPSLSRKIPPGPREDALQLFRDRLRDETGFLRRLRLWLDLFLDLAVSVPLQYASPERAFARASVPHTPGIPLFSVRAVNAPAEYGHLLGDIPH
jgi:hypothetical protein